MPVIGTVDVAVHLHRFHNIDLFCRGVYHLRLSVLLPAAQAVASGEGTDAPQKVDKTNKAASSGGVVGDNPAEHIDAQGIPYMCLAQCEDMNTTVGHRKVPPIQAKGNKDDRSAQAVQDETSLSPAATRAGFPMAPGPQVGNVNSSHSVAATIRPPEEHRLQGPAVHGHYYHSRMFVIRYRDEELELGEVVTFQIPVELNAGRRWLEAGQALVRLGVEVLQMELMFSKLESLETSDAKNDAKKKATNGAGSAGVASDQGDVEEEESTLTLKPVSVQRFHASLGGGHWGIHAYVPVTFSGVHFVRVDCMLIHPATRLDTVAPSHLKKVHGVLRNLKLELPWADLKGLTQPAALTTVAKNENKPTQLAGLEQTSVDADTNLPINLDRLETGGLSVLDCVSDGVSNGDAITAKRRKAFPPKYSWFSLYDDQGVGWRRTPTRREDRDNEVVPEFLPSLGRGGGSVVSEDSSRKGEKMPWRWGWRRRGSGGSRRFVSQEGTSGSYGETVDRDSPQAVELLTLKSLEGPGKRLEILEREKTRRRRKDVYSYFVMPLVRALEAQTGTMTWLRKLLEAKNPRHKPASAAHLWTPPDASCWDDITRVLWRLFAPDEMDVKVEISPPADSRVTAQDGRGQRARELRDKKESSRPSSKRTAVAGGVGQEKGLPSMARVAFPGLITRYSLDPLETDLSESVWWLEDDEATCKALETDVHALAILVFDEWRGFVSALPGCGELLSAETSALWLAQLRQRWACQATLHTCLAVQKPPSSLTTSELAIEAPSPAFNSLGLPSKLPASARGAPLYSRLEPELGSESFGTAVRLACADASAPYRLPLQDQLMFPDGDTMLPVCLVQRYEASKGGGKEVMTGERRTRGNSEGENDDGGNQLGPVVATRSPPLSPVWVPNVTPAFRPPSSKLPEDDESQPPTPTDASCVVIRTPPRPPRLATALPSPIAHDEHVRRAVSCSPEANCATVPTIDASTAAAAVAAAVAAISGEEGSDESQPSSPSVERHKRRGERHRYARSLSAWPQLGDTSGGINTTQGLEKREVSMGRQKPFWSVTPPQPDGTVASSPPRRRRSAYPSPLGKEEGETGGVSTGKDCRVLNRGGDIREQALSFNNIWGREIPFPSRAVTTDHPPNRDPSPQPITPHRSPRLKATTAQARGPASPDIVEPAQEPSLLALAPAAQPRRSLSASPARPPLKPMTDDRGRGVRAQCNDATGDLGVGEDNRGEGAESRKNYVKPGSSLLDGVEQSSDLGAFFRQHGDCDDECAHGGGSTRRRRRGRTSPRSFSNDVDVDADDEEGGSEGETGRSGGVGLHVIVLHHGYCGSSMDMRLIKNYIRILAPDALVLNSESNERDQHTSMKVMGENLAKEVHRFLLVRARSLLLPGGQGRLSFVGHSAGAIIIRAALTYKILEPALKHMHLFVSLGTPHLGTIYGASGILRTGMWAMKRWMKSRLLEEVGLTDAPQPRDTLLCWLSKQPGLEHFRHVVLVSADKDGYAPSQSARVQMCDASVRDAIREVQYGQVVCEMAGAILSPIKESRLYRLHVWGGLKQAGGAAVDDYIGRAAHISMMDSPSLVCLLLCTLLDLIR